MYIKHFETPQKFEPMKINTHLLSYTGSEERTSDLTDLQHCSSNTLNECYN